MRKVYAEKRSQSKPTPRMSRAVESLSDEKPLLAEQMLKQLHEWRLKVDAEMPKAVSAN